MAVKTCEEYVLNQLAITEKKLADAESIYKTLKADLLVCNNDYEAIKKHFVVKLSTDKTTRYLVFRKDPTNGWDEDILAWEGSEKFTIMVELLHIHDDMPEIPSKEEL